MLKNQFNVKNLWKCIFRASRRVSFSYVPNSAPDHGGCPRIPIRIFVNHVPIFSSSPIQTSKMELFVTKKPSWELLLTVVTELRLKYDSS